MSAPGPGSETGAALAGDEVVYRPFDERHWVNRIMLAAGDALRRYHRHRVEGLAHLEAALARGPVVLVGNHVLDVVDPLMLNVAVYRELGRVLRFIGHGNLFFTVPGLRTLAPIWGIIPNRHAALADTVMREERALMLYPGSGTEAILRSYRREPYRLKWFGKLGFVELAARHRASVLFVAGLGIDELYYQTNVPTPAALVRATNAGDDAYYRGARLQLGATGIHILPAILPLPVRVTHVISPPLALDPALDPGDRSALERAQLRLWSEAQAFLDHTLVRRPSDPVDAVLRSAFRALHRLGL
jgi:1-acyl-sn-glycerol-3-phosphate acyltransferase